MIKCTQFEGRKNINLLLFMSNKLRKNKFKKLKDKVKISKYKHGFSKGYIPNLIIEVCTKTKVLNTNLITYRLKYGLNIAILRYFNKQKIIKTNFPIKCTSSG